MQKFLFKMNHSDKIFLNGTYGTWWQEMVKMKQAVI